MAQMQSSILRHLTFNLFAIILSYCYVCFCPLRAQRLLCNLAEVPLRAQRHLCNLAEAPLRAQRYPCNLAEAPLRAQTHLCNLAVASLSVQSLFCFRAAPPHRQRATSLIVTLIYILAFVLNNLEKKREASLINGFISFTFFRRGLLCRRCRRRVRSGGFGQEGCLTL